MLKNLSNFKSFKVRRAFKSLMHIRSILKVEERLQLLGNVQLWKVGELSKLHHCQNTSIDRSINLSIDIPVSLTKRHLSRILSHHNYSLMNLTLLLVLHYRIVISYNHTI